MDRTKEFLSLARTTNIPQASSAQKENATLDTIAAIEEDLNILDGQVSSEKAPSKEIIDRAENLLGTLFDHCACASTSTEVEENIAKAMQRKHTALMLRLTSILSRHKQNEQRKTAQMEIEEQKRPINRVTRKGEHQDSQYIQREIHREEISSVRRREFETLEKHISELGRMVAEVSMHISLQGEKVETIDGLFTKAKSNMRGGSYELKEALEKIKKKRRTMIVIFLILFGILGIKYLRWI